MIPVTLSIHGGKTSKTFHYEVLNNAKLTPVAIMATAFSALQGRERIRRGHHLSLQRPDQGRRLSRR